MNLTRVAVVGPAGTGKSFLINSILGYSAVKHEVSAGPVTLESSCHRAVISVEGEDTVLEMVDTPGLGGQGEVSRTVQEDLTSFNSNLHTLDRVVVVFGNQRLEPEERKDISRILKLLNYKSNPGNFLFLMNDGRQKNIDKTQKEMELSAALTMLGIEDYEICQPGRNIAQNRKVSPAVAVSNCEDANFNDEINYVRSLLKKKHTIKSIVSPAKPTGNHVGKNSGAILMLLLMSVSININQYINETQNLVNDTLTEKQSATLIENLENNQIVLKAYDDSVESKIRNLVEENKKLRISSSEGEVTFNKLLEENTNLKDEKTNAKSKIEQLSKENKDLTKSVSEDERQFNGLKEENKNLKDTETALKSNIVQVNKENQNLKQSISNHEFEANELLEENTKLKYKETNTMSSIEQLRKENKDLTKSVSEDEIQFNDLKEENRTLKDKETNVNSNTEQLIKDNNNLTNSVIEKERKFNDLKEENKNLRDRESTEKVNIEELKNENKKMEKSLEELKNESKKLEKSVDELKNEIRN